MVILGSSFHLLHAKRFSSFPLAHNMPVLRESIPFSLRAIFGRESHPFRLARIHNPFWTSWASWFVCQLIRCFRVFIKRSEMMKNYSFPHLSAFPSHEANSPGVNDRKKEKEGRTNERTLSGDARWGCTWVRYGQFAGIESQTSISIAIFLMCHRSPKTSNSQ